MSKQLRHASWKNCTWPQILWSSSVYRLWRLQRADPFYSSMLCENGGYDGLSGKGGLDFIRMVPGAIS